MEHVTLNQYNLYSNVYNTVLNDVIHRLGWLCETPCDDIWWFWNVDLLGYATIFNWTFVVFELDLQGEPYGETYLPLMVKAGTVAPGGVSYIVCTGNHWWCSPQMIIFRSYPSRISLCFRVIRLKTGLNRCGNTTYTRPSMRSTHEWTRRCCP